MNYLQEWEQSCVDDQLTRMNVISLQGNDPLEYLLYSDTLPRRNDGRVGSQILKRYEHTEKGGWWCSGIDLLTGEEDIWGCFKPTYPRISRDKGKPIKYEHPPKASAGLFALRVPLHLWQKIAARYELEIDPSEIKHEQPDLGFWQWLINHSAIPICLTEGAKKAGALITAGYAAIALPGVNGGYRVPRDIQGNRIGKSNLIPQLAKLASQNREIYITFDQDSKPNTVKAVDAAIRKTGYLLNQAGCFVKIITWNPLLGKGVDDLIATHHQSTFEEAYQKAIPLDTWRAKALTRLTYTPQIQVNCRYLPELSIPECPKLIGIKSPKGTGKTKLLESIVAQAIDCQQKVLVIGHRVRLIQELCQRFGLKYITEVSNSNEEELLGYGLCIDSLHPNSQAQFNPIDWSDSVVIIDEVEQVLWHGLNSDTCKGNRVAILKSLKTLMQNVLGGKGQLFVTDADLSDTSLDYLISLAGISLQPFIIQNDWKPDLEEAWQVHNYTESTPRKLVKDLEKHIREGGKPFVCLSAQKLKSRWGTCTLEAYLQKQFPQAKILRIDSESLAEPSHPAYGCLANLNQLKNYDVVLASPSIETGVSIDLQKHFTSVWCIAQGIQATNSVCQALGRIRENVPRHIWVASYGFNQVGNGSTSIPSLLTSGHRLTQLNIRLLQQSDFEAIDDLDTGFQAESLLCWAKMAVRINASMIQYRESIVATLRGEGHQVMDASSVSSRKKEVEKELRTNSTSSQGNRKTASKGQNNNKREANRRQKRKRQSEESASQNQLTEAINAVREQNYQAECKAIAFSQELANNQYQVLKGRLVKTSIERRSLRKYELKQRYRIPVTTQLVVKDDDGWYQKLRIHYFLTVGSQYLAKRDKLVAQRLIEQGQGSVFLPDFNSSQLGAIIGTMNILGISVLLANPQRELRNTDQDLQKMAAIALSNRSAIKTAVGIGLAKNSTPITIIRRFLDQIGYGLKCIRTETRDKKTPQSLSSS